MRVTRLEGTWRTVDGKQHQSPVTAWEHELDLANDALRELCRDHVKAGPADAFTVTALLLDECLSFASALARIQEAHAALYLLRDR